jgi:citrate synthase
MVPSGHWSQVDRSVPVTEWINAAEAARQLGVKQATLYSYVSRGVLTRRRGTGGKISLFDAAEVGGLARRGRPRQPPGLTGLVIESGLTEIADDTLRFRGVDALDLAQDRLFEEVSALLWTGALTAAGAAVPWRATPEAVRAGRAAQAALPPGTLPLERLQVIVPALAAADPLRLHLDPPAVIAAGQAIIGGMVDCLPAAAGDRPAGDRPAGDGPAGDGPAGQDGGSAGRLWPKLCPDPAPAALPGALSAALVLLADHELAASTLAARVAASVRADPYAVVATGLGALGGALHGGASLGAEAMLAAADDPAGAPRVVGDLLRRGERVPGFGHFVYRAGDPRAGLLLAMIRRALPASPQLAVADAILAETHRRALPEPNIDFALAVLASCAGMISGAGEAIFAIARTAGWLAHGLEEYAARTPLRPRAVYTGPPAARP